MKLQGVRTTGSREQFRKKDVHFTKERPFSGFGREGGKKVDGGMYKESAKIKEENRYM